VFDLNTFFNITTVLSPMYISYFHHEIVKHCKSFFLFATSF